MNDLNIRHFKLLSCEEIICLVVSDNEDNYLIERPYTMVPKLNSNNELEYILEEWFGFVDTTSFTIPKSAVICHCEIDDNIKDIYLGYTMDYASIKSVLVPKDDNDIEYTIPENNTVH